jgi:hypothetical protein
MLKRGFKIVDGLDPSQGMLKEAEKRIYSDIYIAVSSPLNRYLHYSPVSESIW